MPDYVHIFVSIPPKYSVSGFKGYLKSKSALMIFDKLANLKAYCLRVILIINTIYVLQILFIMRLGDTQKHRLHHH